MAVDQAEGNTFELGASFNMARNPFPGLLNSSALAHGKDHCLKASAWALK
jgi:hypothetical protein